MRIEGSMRMLDFLLFYEIKNREFESIVLLRNELVKRGYSVEYISFLEIENRRKRNRYHNKVKVAVMPSLYHDAEVIKIVYRTVGKCQKIINLRWEQLFTNAIENDLSSYVYPKGLAKEAHHCNWGKQTHLLLRKVGINENNNCVTGPVQMDILSSSFREVFYNREDLFEKYNIEQDKKVICFVSSFSLSTFSDSEFEAYLSQFDLKERASVEEFTKIEKESRRQIIEWLIKLALDRECIIIYRPHPMEINTEEIRVLHNYSNIRIIREENIKQWFLTCDKIFMWYSTSAAEAFFANVPCAILRPLSIDFKDELPIYRDVNFINSYEKFVMCIDDDMELDKYYFNSEVIDSYYNIDNVPAYKKTCDFFELVYSSDEDFPWYKIKKFKLWEVRWINLKVDLKRTIGKALIFLFDRGVLSKCQWLNGKICKYKRNMERRKDSIITVADFQLMQEKLGRLQYSSDDYNE